MPESAGRSLIMAIHILIDAGIKENQIIFINIIYCSEGLQALVKSFPSVKIVMVCIDEYLNKEKFIFPGLEDYSDRYFNT